MINAFFLSLFSCTLYFSEEWVFRRRLRDVATGLALLQPAQHLTRIPGKYITSLLGESGTAVALFL